MRYIKANFLTIGLLSLFLYTGNDCQADHRLRVGTLRLPNQNRLIVLGITPRFENRLAGLDFTQLGFEGAELGQLDPKFLLEISPEGITKVRTFELETLSEAEITTAEVDAELPPLLLDLPHAKGDKVIHFFGNLAAASGKSLGFPIATGTVLLRRSEKHEENLHKLRASYLMELVNKTLPPFNKFPEFKDALSLVPERAEHYLRKLGEALLIRYNPKSNWAGIHIDRTEEGAFYENWRQVQFAKRVENKGYLVRRANELELNLSLIEDDFAYVFVDANNPEVASTENYLEKFMGLGSAQKGPKEIINGVNLDLKAGPLIPWYLVSFVNPDGPVDLVNFVFPGKFGKRLKQLNEREIDLDLAGSFIPMSNWLLRTVDHGIQAYAYKHEQTKYLSRLESYGAILALTETQAYDSLPLDGIAYKQFEYALTPFENNFHWGSKSQSESLNDIVSLLAAEEERIGRLRGSLSSSGRQTVKSAHLKRLRNFLVNSGYFPKAPELRELEVGQTPKSKASRSPCGSAQSVPVSVTPKRKPIIIFMIDGLRPDRFKQAAQLGHFPRLRSLFYDRGAELESYTYRSLTLPSWSSFLTGKKPDFHGIRSNTPTSRIDHRVTDNYQDARKDLLEIKNWVKNRAFQRVEEDTLSEGKTWLPDYFHKDEAVFNYMPIVSGAKSAAIEVVKDFLNNSDEYISGVKSIVKEIDRASALTTAAHIRNDKDGKLRLVMNWYVGVDEASHYNNRSLPAVYKEIDYAVGLVLDAAKDHPSLKDATVVLVSDHGHSAGFGPFDAQSTVYNTDTKMNSITEGPLMANTGLNMTRFLAGEVAGNLQYNFVVGAADSPAPKFDLRVLEEFLIQPYKYTYPKGRGNPTALVDCSGDNLVQIYIKGDPNWNRLSFSELSHFPGGKNGELLNIPADLLNYQVKNLMITDAGLHNRVLELTDRHPVNLFAMALPGKAAKESADLLGADDKTGASTREPVLVINRRKNGGNRTGLILTRSDHNGNDTFRYVVLKNFSQEETSKKGPSAETSGKITALTSNDPEDDPLQYLGTVFNGAESFATWRTDREWLALARGHSKPTAIFSLANSLTLPPKFTDPHSNTLSSKTKENRQGEIPDFLMISNPGFGFHSDAPLESDHGGLAREEVNNTLFVSSLDPELYSHHSTIPTPVFNHDVMPTLLELTGVGQRADDPIASQIQGHSFKALLDEVR